jgi:hypothetical protein
MGHVLHWDGDGFFYTAINGVRHAFAVFGFLDTPVGWSARCLGTTGGIALDDVRI